MLSTSTPLPQTRLPSDLPAPLRFLLNYDSPGAGHGIPKPARRVRQGAPKSRAGRQASRKQSGAGAKGGPLVRAQASPTADSASDPAPGSAERNLAGKGSPGDSSASAGSSASKEAPRCSVFRISDAKSPPEAVTRAGGEKEAKTAPNASIDADVDPDAAVDSGIPSQGSPGCAGSPSVSDAACQTPVEMWELQGSDSSDEGEAEADPGAERLVVSGRGNQRAASSSSAC